MKDSLNKGKRILYAILGVLSAILGMIGIVVPGLPKTPFLLLSAYLLSRSSPKIHNYFMSIKIINSTVTKFTQKKGVSWRVKFFTIALMWGTIMFSIWIRSESETFIYTILILGVIGALSIIIFVPNEKKETENQ